MPPHHEFDHEIHIENDQTPPHSHIYPLSGTELGLLREFLNDMLGKGFIRSSQSPGGAPVLLLGRRTAPCDSVWTSRTSTRLLRRIGTQSHSSPTSLTNWAVQRSTQSSTSMLVTTMFVLQLATSGRQPSKHNMAPLSSWLCQWGSPTLKPL